MSLHQIGLYVMLAVSLVLAAGGSLFAAMALGETPVRDRLRAALWLGFWLVFTAAIFAVGMVFPEVS